MRNNKTTLKEFIEKNYRLLTILGVFAALTSFFASAYPENYILSFSTFIMFLLISWEFWISFPESEKSSTNLNVFEYLFFALLLGVAGQIIMSYKDLLITFSSIIFFVIYSFLISKLIDRFELFLFVRNIAEKHMSLGPLIRGLAFTFMVGVAFLLASASARLLELIVN